MVACVIVVLALDEAGSSLASRSVAAIFVWWGLLLTAVFSLSQRERIPRVAVACVGLLLALALLAGLSTGWAPSAEAAFEEMDRLLLYAGIVLVAVVFGRRGQGGRWADGMAAAVALVGLLALAQRLFPGLLPESGLAGVLPDAATRLSYPVGYWNGLGCLLGLGFPLLLRAAVSARRSPWRAVALAPLPALAAALYLTSSRGGVAVAVVGALVFVVLAGERLRALLALVVAALGSAGAVAAVAAHAVLEDGPLDSAAASAAGREAALLVAVAAVASGLVYAALAAVTPARLRVPALVWAALAVAVVAAVVLADPGARLREFKAPPPPSDVAFGVGSHLASGAGSGRWQFWQAAVEQFKAHPFVGGGAGSYESWWAQHGSIDWFVRNAHSLWLETLGELGLVGFLLLVAAFGLALVAGFARLPRRTPEEQTLVAALLAVLLAFVLGNAIDWIWQLPAIAAVGLLALGLLVGPATAEDAPVPHPRPGESAAAATRRLGVRVAVGLLAWAVICAQAVPLIVTLELDASRRAVARGDLPDALARARSARTVQPWAASPRLQLALAHERGGDLDAARADLGAAIARDERDWRLQVVAARLAAKDGDVAAARRALQRARALNPRSRLLREAR